MPCDKIIIILYPLEQYYEKFMKTNYLLSIFDTQIATD